MIAQVSSTSRKIAFDDDTLISLWGSCFANADAAKMSDINLIELAMDPPELGKVRMSMSEAAGVMTVNIAAASAFETCLAPCA